MAGWHHRCNEHELGQTLGDGERQGGLACCSPWDWKESDMTEWLTKIKLIYNYLEPQQVRAEWDSQAQIISNLCSVGPYPHCG